MGYAHAARGQSAYRIAGWGNDTFDREMKSCRSPLHIVSAQFGEVGLTYAQRTVDGKSSEIPAVQKLMTELDIRGCYRSINHCRKLLF